MLSIVLSGCLYWGVGLDLVESWQVNEEYSHGFFLPFIAGYMVWQRKEQFENNSEFLPSWWGTVIAILALCILFIGVASFTGYLEKVSLLLLLAGLFVARYGFRVLPIVLIPLLLIFLSYPLPFFINAQLTSGMQLISSEFGVAVIRLFAIPVFLEGNVIDLGNYKLQVVEACSGLRYMFPLMSLSLILAYFFQVAIWKRVVMFLSAIPITILMNSFRIGAIGILSEYRGVGSADGFMHAFEGWFIFLCCLLLLFVEMWLMTSKERKTRRFSSLLTIR